jgi:hypothetical protein
MDTSSYFSKITEESLKYIYLTDNDILLIRRIKNTLVKSQLYAEAAALRDIEKQMIVIMDAMSKHGYKPKPLPESDEKIYSIDDVTQMLNLATAPLKKTLQEYEELSRTAIIDHVAGLIKINEELRKNQKSTPEAAPYVVTGDQPLSMKCEHDGCEKAEGRDYKRKEEVGNWAGEPIFLCDEHSGGFEASST